MDVYDAIRGRVAVKEFKPDPVPEAVLRKILLAARWAPSQRNRQPWHFVVVRDPETIREIGGLASSGEYIAQAPVAIAVVVESDRPMQRFDAARAIENMLLVAWSHGVGTSYVGQMDRDRIKDILRIPAEMELVTVMPYGYPAPTEAAKGKRRKPLGEIASRGTFGVPYA